jgi:hypothetical protein
VGLSAERTLNVEGVPLQWRCEQKGCFFVALYALRSALENGCSKICVKRGAQHKHYFDVVELCLATKKVWGYAKLARPKVKSGQVPALLGTLRQRASGNWFDRQRPLFRVLTSLKATVTKPLAPLLTSVGGKE